MKTLYLDCGMGAAGDMLTAALMELLEDKEGFVEELNALGIPNVTYKAEVSSKCGIMGTHMSVKVNGEEEGEEMHSSDHEHTHEHHHEHDHDHHHDHDHEHHHDHDHHEHEHHHDHDHEHHHDHEHTHDHHHHHHHTSLHDIRHIVEKLPVSERVKSDVVAVYELIAQAESHAHGMPVEQIHFHEVGSMDAVADVTAVCMLMEKLGADQIIASPVHVGAGTVKCAHGILPVPAPATAFILADVPIYGGMIKSELCTPTGAALLKHFVKSFGDMPVMKISKVGYGMGKKDFERANCVRAMIGETQGESDDVIELSCNLDDISAEAIGFAQEELLKAGALDVYTSSIQMKKSRPATMLNVLCKEEDRDTMVELIFRHTTTLGIREKICHRYTLKRQIETISTPYGDIRKKVSSGYGVKREKIEFDDIAKIAREQNISFLEAKQLIEGEEG